MVIAKYHPHGDSAVYDYDCVYGRSLFSMRLYLGRCVSMVTSGSVEGDSAAASKALYRKSVYGEDCHIISSHGFRKKNQR